MCVSAVIKLNTFWLKMIFRPNVGSFQEISVNHLLLFLWCVIIRTMPRWWVSISIEPSKHYFCCFYISISIWPMKFACKKAIPRIFLHRISISYRKCVGFLGTESSWVECTNVSYRIAMQIFVSVLECENFILLNSLDNERDQEWH